MTVEEALAFFNNIYTIERKLRTLNEVGLGYLKLGQPATTLSGGEAQRIKLAQSYPREVQEKLFISLMNLRLDYILLTFKSY